MTHLWIWNADLQCKESKGVTCAQGQRKGIYPGEETEQAGGWFHRIIEMLVERDCWRSGVKSSAPGRTITLDQICSGFSQLCFQPPRTEIHSFSGWCVPVLHYPLWKRFSQHLAWTPPGAICSHCPQLYRLPLPRRAWLQHLSNCPWRRSGCCKIASQPPLCQAKQAQLPQPSPASPCRLWAPGLPLLDAVQFLNSFEPGIQTFLTPSRYDYSNAEQRGMVISLFPWRTNQARLPSPHEP